MKLKKVLSMIICCFAIPTLIANTPDQEKQPFPTAYFIDTLFETLPDNPQIHSLTLHLVNEWQHYKETENPNFDTEKLILAIIYGAEKHHGQTRKDKESTPYIIHPLQVCNNLWEIGQIRNSNILTAAILHDTLEDTSATFDEIQKYFGSRVGETVREVTNDPALDSEKNKQRQIDHAPLLSQDARLVKLADRLANVTDLSASPPAWSEQKVNEYYTWGQKLLTALKGTNSYLEAALQKEIDTHHNS